MSTSTSTRAFIVDDHRVVRMGFRIALEQMGDFTVIGEAGSGEEALEKIPQECPSLAIVDIAMDGMDGIELTRHLKKICPDVRVLVVSMHDDTYYIERALEAGADGYLLKDNADGLMISAAQAVLAGQLYLCSKAKRRLED